MPEMSKAEEAAFASMREETSAPASEPEPAEDEAPLEGAGPPPQGEEGEAPETEGEAQAKPAERARFVPQAALHEERSRRQQLEAENRRLSEERTRFDERLKVIQEMNRPQPEPEPDAYADPIAKIVRQDQRIADLEQRIVQGNQQWTEQQQQAEQVRRIAQAASADADRFKTEKPDYDQAYQFWMRSRAGEMQAQGLPSARIVEELQKEELQISAGAFQRSVSPAETLYEIAKHRGYKAGNGRADNGHDGAAEQIQRVATGQQRNQTLSGTGGGAAPVQMTAERLIAMSADEFDAWTSKNPAATQRLMGKDPPRRRA
jgi:hypothetical protein